MNKNNRNEFIKHSTMGYKKQQFSGRGDYIAIDDIFSKQRNSMVQQITSEDEESVSEKYSSHKKTYN